MVMTPFMEIPKFLKSVKTIEEKGWEYFWSLQVCIAVDLNRGAAELLGATKSSMVPAHFQTWLELFNSKLQ